MKLSESSTVTCGNGAYLREADGVWRYAWGDPVPAARDLTVAEILAVGADPLEVMAELCREVDDDLAHGLRAARRAAANGNGDAAHRHLGAVVCGLQAPELLGPVLLDASQVAGRLQVTRATVDSYRARGRMPAPQLVRGRTPLWAAPVIRRFAHDRSR